MELRTTQIAKDEKEESQAKYDHFIDMVAILNTITSNGYYGMLKGQISMNLSHEHPMIAKQWNSKWLTY